MRDNLSIIKDSYSCGAKGDILGMLADIADNCEWTEMAGNIYAGTYVGVHEILKNVFVRIGNDWDDFAARPYAFYDIGDTIITLGKYSGVSKKTGKSYVAKFTHVWKLKDYKIVDFEQFTDTAIMRFAMDQPYSQ